MDYVESRQLLCLWKQHRAFVKDEENCERLAKYNEERGYREESPVSSAIDHVFGSVGDEITCWNGILSGTPEAIDRLRVRAGMETGRIHRMPTSIALERYICRSMRRSRLRRSFVLPSRQQCSHGSKS